MKNKQDSKTGSLRRICRDRAFVFCCLFLIFSTFVLQVGAQLLDVYFIKEAIPLQASFDQLSEAGLWPYVVKQKIKIENDDVLAELGTEDYLQWWIQDSRPEPQKLGGGLLLFLTYYTGDPGQVPHVPEVCYVGAGGVVTHREEGTIQIENHKQEAVEIPLRILTIQSTKMTSLKGQKIIYFFIANGRYVCERNGVRLQLNNWWDRHAYFSKVEISISGGGDLSVPETLDIVKPFLEKLIPLLENSHWPVWPVGSEAAESQAEAGADQAFSIDLRARLDEA